jgi:hypothetical protein
MLKRYMHRRERHLVMLNDNRVVRPFEWGSEYISDDTVEDPKSFFSNHTKSVLKDSEAFFRLTESPKAGFDGMNLSWQSPLETPFPENNRVHATLFPYEKNKKSAVVILPHWNAKEGTYFDLCKVFNKVGVTALRLTLPYHEKRMPPHLERADYLVAPNVGQTIQSVRQAVLDTKSAVRWLHEAGYENIGIVGTSIGSCTAFLAFVHDPLIKAAVFNHVSSYFADVVWKGLSTYHVKAALEKKVTLEELREYWKPISPAAYMEKLASQEARPQRYIYTLYDLTFPLELSRQTISLLDEYKVKHSRTSLPCGHYTLGEKPWVYIDGYKIISFLKFKLG